jgi:hypothetical protein
MNYIKINDKSEIAKTIIEEGNLQLVKDTNGPSSSMNMWHLYIKNTRGYYQEIKTIQVDDAQRLVKAKLPFYELTSMPDWHCKGIIK